MTPAALVAYTGGGGVVPPPRAVAAEPVIEGEYLGRRTTSSDQQGYSPQPTGTADDRATGRQASLRERDGVIPARSSQLALYEQNGRPWVSREGYLVDIYA